MELRHVYQVNALTLDAYQKSRHENFYENYRSLDDTGRYD